MADSCKWCGGLNNDDRVVRLQVGGWMHREPCWAEALDRAVEAETALLRGL